ncbi:MAG: pyrroloquinoline quinone biosynthesis peptide chaperone PqqD [Rhodospirillales bacterium]|nr:pyrroloquinoline quinone biosynthesis peptide chaperone PqqD [Rhodospirillales bacterium]
MAETLRIDPTDRFELHPFYMFRWEERQKAYLLMYPEGIVKLNETAAETLKRCDGDRSVTEIIDELKEEVKNGPNPESASLVEKSVCKFLEESTAKGWIRRKKEGLEENGNR